MDYTQYPWLSIIPPIVAIGLAVLTRHVIVSLFIGVFIGAVILANGNPLEGASIMVLDVVRDAVADEGNALIIVLLVCVGGFVGVIQRSGAMNAFVVSTAKSVTNPLRAQLAAWFSGIVIFFSASASVLVLGPVYQPIFDRVKSSREKLAYIVDSTSSPIAAIIPISSWAVFIVGLIKVEFDALGVEMLPMQAFIQSIPSQFYALGSVAFVGLVAAFRTDFGPMRAAEKRVAETGEKHREGAKPPRSDEPSAPPKKGTASVMYVALATLFVVVVVTFVVTGGFPNEPLGVAFTKGDAGLSSTFGFVLAVVVAGVMIVRQRTMRVLEIVDEWVSGGKEMFLVTLILVLAWSIGGVCKDLDTAGFVTTMVGGSLSPALAPALIFIVGAMISFATGTSWGSYAILMPIAIPLGAELGVEFPVVIAAVLSGGLMGDHCSPISDTTVLSSISAACDHMEHVRTQMPYALLVSLVAAPAFVVAHYAGTWIGLLFTMVALTAVVLVAKTLSARRRAA